MSQPDQPETGATEEKQQPVGFWRRMFGGPEKPAEATGEAEPEELGPERIQAEVVEPARPRRRSRTREEEQARQERFGHAAMIRREKMARAIGDRVEQVIQDRMETGEEKLARVAQSFQEVRTLLGAIGKNLDQSAERSERIARALVSLPEAGARGQELLERVVTLLATLPPQGERGQLILERIGAAIEEHGSGEQELLGRIERVLEEQSAAARTLAENGVPQVLALARQGQDAAQERLLALREIETELTRQRDQRERLIAAVRESTERCEGRLMEIHEALTLANVQARQDAGSLRGSLERVADRLIQTEDEESRREEQRSLRLEQGLVRLARILGEGQVANAAAAAAHDRAVDRLHDAHLELMDALQRSQHRTLSEMQRIQEEVTERADALARRARRTVVACACAVLLALGIGFVGRSGRPAEPRVAGEERPTSTTGVLPAGIARTSR